uniref:Uncharacterized protein n=1 Tax=Arundo donax TaxID=35708 RepID=A0A0A8YN02_ARUDO
MAAAAADAARASPLPGTGTGPALARPEVAAAKALTYLSLASLWVGGAGLAVAAFADLAFADRAWGAGSPVIDVLKFSTKAILFGGLLAVVVMLLLLRAALLLSATGSSVNMDMGSKKISTASKGSMLRETVVLGWFAALPFVLLSSVSCFVMKRLSPEKGSQTGMVCTVIFDVGVVASMAITCVVTIPSMVVKLWRMKLGGEDDEAADSIV